MTSLGQLSADVRITPNMRLLGPIGKPPCMENMQGGFPIGSKHFSNKRSATHGENLLL